MRVCYLLHLNIIHPKNERKKKEKLNTKIEKEVLFPFLDLMVFVL